MQFVIQEHHGRTHHFDFRLEKDGVFKSWSVPRGLPRKAGVQRLAIQVADHDLAFGDFEGEIPEGQPGAGSIRICERGDYELREWTGNRIVVVLNGQRFRGVYWLIRFRRKGSREWLIEKREILRK